MIDIRMCAQNGTVSGIGRRADARTDRTRRGARAVRRRPPGSSTPRRSLDAGRRGASDWPARGAMSSIDLSGSTQHRHLRRLADRAAAPQPRRGRCASRRSPACPRTTPPVDGRPSSRPRIGTESRPVAARPDRGARPHRSRASATTSSGADRHPWRRCWQARAALIRRPVSLPLHLDRLPSRTGRPAARCRSSLLISFLIGCIVAQQGIFHFRFFGADDLRRRPGRHPGPARTRRAAHRDHGRRPLGQRLHRRDRLDEDARGNRRAADDRARPDRGADRAAASSRW